MSALLSIRRRLNFTQAELASRLGMSQGNLSFCENGQTITPESALKLIEVARAHGLVIGMDHVYGLAELPSAAAEQGA